MQEAGRWKISSEARDHPGGGLGIFGYPAINRWLTVFCMAAPPIAGSALSVLLHGAGLWTLFRVLAGYLPLSRDRGLWAVAIPLALYCFATLIAFIANPIVASSWRCLPGLAIFLLYPFLYSAWSLWPKDDIARATVIGAAAGCYGAFALAAIQSGWLGIWAEGGAGNAAMFGMVTSAAAAIVLAGLFVVPRPWTAALCGALVAAAAAIVLSRARTSAVALIVTAAIVLVVHRRQIRRAIPVPVLAALAVGLAAVTVFGSGILAGRVGSLFADWRQLADGDLGTSLGFRIGLWRIGADLVRDRPLLGYGPQWTPNLIADGFRQRFDMPVGFSHFHNGFLTVWVESGMFGVAALLSVFAAAAASALTVLNRSGTPTEVFGATLLTATILIYPAHGMTGLMIGHDIADALLVMLLIVGTVLASGSQPGQKVGEDPPRHIPADRRQQQEA